MRALKPAHPLSVFILEAVDVCMAVLGLEIASKSVNMMPFLLLTELQIFSPDFAAPAVSVRKFARTV